MVGLIPLFATETLEPELLDKLPGFKERLEWFETNRPNLSQNVPSFVENGMGKRRLLAIVRPDKLKRILEKMLDETEFLAPNGIRALSRYHHEHPYVFYTDGGEHRVDYEPAESSTGLFGGNSNWRGPIWFPVNYLLVESLQKFHHYLGDEYQVECPTGSGTYKSQSVQQILKHFSSSIQPRPSISNTPLDIMFVSDTLDSSSLCIHYSPYFIRVVALYTLHDRTNQCS